MTTPAYIGRSFLILNGTSKFDITLILPFVFVIYLNSLKNINFDFLRSVPEPEISGLVLMVQFCEYLQLFCSVLPGGGVCGCVGGCVCVQQKLNTTKFMSSNCIHGIHTHFSRRCQLAAAVLSSVNCYLLLKSFQSNSQIVIVPQFVPHVHNV